MYRILIIKTDPEVVATEVEKVIGSDLLIQGLQITSDGLAKCMEDLSIGKKEEKKEENKESVADQDDYVPLSSLNLYSTDWKIKARITKLGNERSWNNDKGTGKLQNFDLIDDEGTQMQVTMFNE